jgi:Family of unknown function (DUF6519)
MTFDNSRFPFNPWKDYCGVVGLQGRVHLESEWNEWLAENNRRFQAGTLDSLGRIAVPATTPYAFQITASADASGNHLAIGPGRMYVDGILAENHGDAKTAQWDPALAELSGSPQPPPATSPAGLDYTNQPYLPGATLPAGNGPFLAYLDVWHRAVTYLEDPDLIDKAVGVDTTGRLQNVWQVKLLDLSNSGGGITCSSSISAWDALIQPSAGQLTTGVVQSTPSGPCCLSPNTGYTGMENQFYRVQIHQTPATGGAANTFKWSRDNGSVETGVTGIAGVTNTAGNPASALTVLSMGRDNVLGFAPGNWIEITDDIQELNGLPGELHQIDSVDFAAKVIVLDKTVASASFPVTSGQTDPTRHTRITRWDQAGKIYQSDGVTVWADLGTAGSTGDIPVPPAGTTLILENGITVAFGLNPAAGTFHSADFWTFAARTADGSVEVLTNAFPRGIHHHYARLSVVTFPSSATDCRPTPPNAGGDCDCCCTCTVGDGVESVGQFTKIQDAINSLPAEGGEICILPGRYFENVEIAGLTDVVIHGCGWRTRVASPSLAPIQLEAKPAATGGSTALSTVITIAASRHIELRSFVVEAGDGDVGILVDGAAVAPPSHSANAAKSAVFSQFGVIDVTIKEMVLVASTMPAVLARKTQLLRVDNNRIAMENVRGSVPAVYASGAELHIDQNWIGLLQSTTIINEWLPTIVTSDLSSSSSPNASTTTNTGFTMQHPGGIQIGGPSKDVYILENEIEGGSRNGITLGSLDILDSKGKSTGQWIGVLVTPEDKCSTTGTIVVTGTIPGTTGSSVVSAGPLTNIQIHRNRIRNMGLCGIGPVGFFDLTETQEIISIAGLNISENEISTTLQRAIDPVTASQASFLGYGAISVPDVNDLRIRDNSITNFGATPGLPVCGIFTLHGEMIDISHNKILDTRDWTELAQKPTSSSGVRGGIIVLATPPSFVSLASAFTAVALPPVYEPGLPALRVEHNTVRIPLGEALIAYGIGPFSVVNNHFSTGGNVQGAGTQIAQTVLLVNLGKGIDSAATASTPSGLYTVAQTSKAGFTSVAVNPVTEISSGAVLFTNNVCQLEARLAGLREDFSVFIFTLDQLTFANNHCWVDGASQSALADAFLLGSTLNAIGNRFQESAHSPVLLSGVTVGIFNITSQNISTYCLVPLGPHQHFNNNFCLTDPTNEKCSRAFDDLAGQ